STAGGAAALELVEEASLDEALPLLGGDLHVGRGEQVDARGDHLDLPIEAEDQPGGEVHQATRDLIVGALEVHDDRHALPIPLPDVARVVEATGLGTMDRGHGRDS